MTRPEAPDGFGSFFRRYARSWQHAVATAALTAFGMLTFVHRGFAALAVAAYVVPPVALYLTGKGASIGRAAIDGEPVEGTLAEADPAPEADTASQPGSATAGVQNSALGSTNGSVADADTDTAGDTDSDADTDTAGDTDSDADTDTAGDTDSDADTDTDGVTDSDTATDTAGDSDTDGDPDTETDADPDSDPDSGTSSPAGAPWTTVESPTDATLFDVTVTDVGAYAVGADGVVLVDDGRGWDGVLADGSAADSQTLRGVDATDDGGAVWIAGDGGSVARLDAETGRHVDRSAPRDLTDTWTDVAVGGSADDEVVLLVNGSGEVLRGRHRDGEAAWDAPVKPGGGSSLSGVALANASVGYACDTNDGIYETSDGGETFQRIGVEGADGVLTDVGADACGEGEPAVVAVADDGILHRRDDGTWTPVRLGEEPLAAVTLRDGCGLACGAEAVYECQGGLAGATDWDRTVLPGPGPFEGVALGGGRAIAVGADGTIVERS